jgi:hypothetical protein
MWQRLIRQPHLFFDLQLSSNQPKLLALHLALGLAKSPFGMITDLANDGESG